MITGDAATLEIILDGMSEHARMASENSTLAPVWRVRTDDEHARISLWYEGEPNTPPGWMGEILQVHSRGKHHAVLLAREAARALRGQIEFAQTENQTELMLELPLVKSEQRIG
jgi:hypothetical protein